MVKSLLSSALALVVAALHGQALAAPTAPSQTSNQPPGVGKFVPGMSRDAARAAGQLNCIPERRNRDGQPAEVRCDIPMDQVKLGTIKVVSAKLIYDGPRFDTVSAIYVRVADSAFSVSVELGRSQGLQMGKQRRSYSGSRAGVTVTAADDFEEPEASITWRLDKQPDPKLVAKQKAQEKREQDLMKKF